MGCATFLLPDGACFGAQRLSQASARQLGRGDGPAAKAQGRRAQLRRYFALPPGAWPLAALSRQADVGDAGNSVWLRADPACLRPDINGVRLIAHGQALGLSDADLAALLPALKPLFGDAGMTLDAPSPHHWYLRLQSGAPLPAFSDPGEALGEDYLDHLVEGDEGQRWRALLNEVQVALHHHPRNAERTRQGLLPVNALWFWGGGRLPTATGAAPARHTCVHGDEASLLALAGQGRLYALPERYPQAVDDALYDLTATRDLAWLDAFWLQPALQDLRAGVIDSLVLDTEGGDIWTLRRSHRWRFWRRPLERFSR